jgi:hypothetical protein
MNKPNVKFHKDRLDGKACLKIQLQGRIACQDCIHKDLKVKEGEDKGCPSPDIRRTGKNSLGFEVPVQDRPAKDKRSGIVQK